MTDEVAHKWAEKLGAPVLPIRQGKACTVKRWQELTADELAEHKHWEESGDCYAVRLDDLTVIDIDNLPLFEEETGLWWDRLDTLTVITGRGGHVYFAGARGVAYEKYGWGDIRSGPTRYVIGPEARRDDGTTYRVVNDPELLPVAEIPDLGEPVRVAAVDSDGPIEEGGRDNALTSIGGKLRHAGASAAAIEVHLAEVNKTRCTPPLPKADVQRIAQSVARYEPEREVGTKVKAAVKRAERDTFAAQLERATLGAVPPPAPPVVVADPDGLPLLFGGEAVTLFGAGGVGKSWAALALSTQCAAQGGRSLFIAWERLSETRRRAYPMVPHELRGAWKSAEAEQVYKWESNWREWLDGSAVSLVVMDSLSRAGVATDGTNFADWFRGFAEPFMAPDRCIVMIDHSRKRVEGPTADNQIGSRTKSAIVDAAYMIRGGAEGMRPTKLTKEIELAKSNAGHTVEKMELVVVRNRATVTNSARDLHDMYERVQEGSMSMNKAAKLIDGVTRSGFRRGYLEWRDAVS